MEAKVRIIHYINQFFGQVGGEDKADIAPFLKEGPVGPGLLLKNLLGEKGEIIATIICGDNYFSNRIEEAKREVLHLIAAYKPNLIIAGPAFNAGRYGIACAEVCKLAKGELSIEAVTGMYPENPGTELGKSEVYIIETGPSARSMDEAMAKMIRLGLKLISKVPVGRPQEEGYIPKGIKRNIISQDLASERAIRALLSKMRGVPFRTEITNPTFDQVPPAPPIEELSRATIALVTEGGLIPKENPDQIESHRATKYGRYSLEGLSALDSGRFESIHRGYDTTFVNEDPNRLVPVDAMRELEREGIFAKLYPYFFTTTGCATFVENSRKIGKAMAEELKKGRVQGVILTSTWGTGTRCGAVLEKEIERVGIPCVLVTTLIPAALTVGANRIVPGIAITNPVGNPELSLEKEKELRRRLVQKAIEVLQKKIESEKVFEIQ